MSPLRRLYWACAIAVAVAYGYLELTTGFDIIWSFLGFGLDLLP
jgi:hypothetical protein